MKRKPAPHAKSSPILLVDDHPIVREGLARVISEEPDLTVCGQAGTSAEALALVAALRPALVIVDVTLGDASGLELLKELRARQPELPVLVLSMHHETQYAERALRAGASGYIMKQAPPQELVTAIRQALRGEVYLSPAMTRQALASVARLKPQDRRSPVERLSDRELEVFELIGRGHRPRVIAEKLRLSVKTIEYHNGNIKRKLGLANADELRQQAIVWTQNEPRQ